MTTDKPQIPAKSTKSKQWERLAVGLVLAGLVISLVLASVSNGVYQDDDACHYLFARQSWHDAGAMLHWWARPGHNIPTMFAARLGGMFGCRVLSALMTAATALLAWSIARRLLGDTPAAAMAPLLVWIQPLAMTLSTTTLTETPAALYLVLGTWLLLRGNPLWACAVWSLLFVTRLETLALAPLFMGGVAWMAWQRRGRSIASALKNRRLWACAAVLLWAPAVYALAAAMVDVPADGDPLRLFTREYDTQYGTGPLYHYPAIWPLAAGFGVLVLAVVGAFRLGRRAWLVSAATFGLLALHAVLFRFGLFATGGYERFMVPASGLLAVLAAAGLQALFRARGRVPAAGAALLMGGWLLLSGLTARAHVPLPVEMVLLTAAPFVVFGVVVAARGRSIRGAGRVMAAAALAVAALQAGAQVRPLRLSSSPMHNLISRAVREVEASDYAGRDMLTQHVIAHFLSQHSVEAYSIPDSIEKWRAAGQGTLFLWESKYCDKSWEPEESELLRRELDRLGRPIFHESSGRHEVVVYVRAAHRPEGSTTTPDRGMNHIARHGR